MVPIAPRLIAFTGPAGVGKSAAAEFLETQGFARVKFGEALKSMLVALYECAGLDPHEIDRRIEGDLKETPDPILGGKTPRFAMQRIGTEWGRDMLSQDLWVRIWTAKVRKLLASGVSVAVDDLRFANEFDAIRDLGGEVYQLTGPTRRFVKRDHASEGAEFDVDGIIYNNVDLMGFQLRLHSTLGLP